ncbi:MAG: leucyl/phenylalanyl-tRNA--protein transferase [Chitinophagaceae bacterium]
MPVFQLRKELIFPPVHLAEPDGLLAVGGDLSTDRLLLAYRSGIFPWYSGDEILWWSPDPRFVLFPDELKVSKSMEKILRNDQFTFSVDKDFSGVISACKSIDRPGQDGTWILPEIIEAYSSLHRMGFAHSAEAWTGNELAGGLYGVRLRNVFFGESMFSRESNASKFAFIRLVGDLRKDGVEMIDCQVYTPHLESLGARMVSREEFLERL